MEARFSASRIMVVINRMVGKDENSSGFLMNTAVIRIRIEKLSEKAKRERSSSQVGSGKDQDHQDGHDADRQSQIGLADEAPAPSRRRIPARCGGGDIGHFLPSPCEEGGTARSAVRAKDASKARARPSGMEFLSHVTLFTSCLSPPVLAGGGNWSTCENLVRHSTAHPAIFW